MAVSPTAVLHRVPIQQQQSNANVAHPLRTNNVAMPRHHALKTSDTNVVAMPRHNALKTTDTNDGALHNHVARMVAILPLRTAILTATIASRNLLPAPHLITIANTSLRHLSFHLGKSAPIITNVPPHSRTPILKIVSVFLDAPLHHTFPAAAVKAAHVKGSTTTRMHVFASMLALNFTTSRA